MNGVCPHCRRTQRLYDGMVVPHLAAATRWVECPGGGAIAMVRTDREPAAETTEIGSVTETGMINLLAAAMIERGWTVASADAASLPPVTAAILLVQDMMRSFIGHPPENR
jgi:hypothetical protein